MILALTIILLFFVLPSEAHAIPTPDVLVSLVNIVPLLTGTVVAVTGGVYYWISQRIGSRGSTLFFGGIFILILLVTAMGFIWNSNRKANRIAEIAMYLRCDPAAHDAGIQRNRNKDRNAITMWREYGNFKKIRMSQVAELLRQQPDAALISANRRTIQYYSGMPAAKVDGQLYPFSYSRALELSIDLQKTGSKDLYLAGFWYMSMPPSFYKADKSFFSKFDNVYIVKRIRKSDRYVADRDGSLKQMDIENKVINWPVEKEKWIFDEKQIYFPGIANLLTDTEALDLIFQNDVYLLAPYGNYRRSRKNQESLYMGKLLRSINQNRVINIDMHLSTTGQQLKAIAKRLDGKRFMVIGLSKYDWIYEGLDATFEIWEHLDHDTDRFRLIGFNTRLPEVMAIKYEELTSENATDSLREPFWKMVKWFKHSLGISAGFAIFIIAVFLRLLFFPIGVREARSRMKRAKIKHALQGGKRPLWSGSSSVLLRQLKVSSGWEFLGTLVTLLLVLPAYKILSSPPEYFQKVHFLWVDNLTQPDWLLSVLVGGLILYKLRLGSSSTRVLPGLMATIAFVVLLLYVPGSLLVYVSGVLAVTLLQDIIAS
ncbi:MAG: hypothetical protein KAI39_11385, partial [Desulfobulbaceae bacterium]|nr:hypothetical protein [Desulfobulbaceae bacterium]